MPPPVHVSLHQPDRSSLSPTPSPVKPRKEPNTPLSVKPSIAELLRTAHHPPSITLIVASIKIIPVSDVSDVSDVSSSALQTFHLHLTDSEYVIQAVFIPQMHRFVITEDVIEGSVLQLVEYDIRIARRKRDPFLNANTTHAEKVVYLAIRDFHTLGCRANWRDTYLCCPSTESVARINDDGNRADDELSPVKIPVKRTMQVTPRRWRPYHTQPSQGRKHQAKSIIQYEGMENGREPLNHLPTIKTTSSTTTAADMSARIPRPPQFQPHPHSHTYSRGQRPTTQPIRPTTIMPTPPMNLNLNLNLNNPNPNLPNPSPPPYPNLITRLSKIPHLRPHHTVPLTILAIPLSISPTTIQRPRLGTKRDIRLVDMSLLGPKPSITSTNTSHITTSTGVTPAISTTSVPASISISAITTTTTTSFVDPTSTPTIGHMKGIQLSVWVDADGFLPEIGRVALARGVRSHPWEGGSLNAWGRWCGVDWWVGRESNASHVDGHRVDGQQGMGPAKEELGLVERREEGAKREMGLNPRGMVLNPREMVQKQRHVARDGIQIARTTPTTDNAMQPIDSAVLLQMENLQRWWDTEGKLLWGVVDVDGGGAAADAVTG